MVNKKLDSVNIISFIIHGMVSIRLLSIPRDIVEYSQNNGWLSVLLMGAYTFIIGYAFYWIGNKYDGLTFSEICNKIFGSILGRIFIIGIGVYTIVSVGLGVRIFADGIRIFLLDKTPLFIIITMMILACLYCILKGIKTISIVLDILLPVILIFIGGLVLLSLSSIETMNLRPYFYGGIKPIVQGALKIADPFLTVGIIGYVLPYFYSMKGMKKWIAVSITGSVIIYTIIVLLCIMVFGSSEIEYLLFPTITLSKSIRLETSMLERAESLYMAAWVPITFTTIILFYLASTLNLKAFFNTKKDRLIIFAQVPLFFFVALYPKNISEVFNYIQWNEKIGQLLIFFLVPLVVLIQLIKDRGRHAK